MGPEHIKNLIYVMKSFFPCLINTCRCCENPRPISQCTLQVWTLICIYMRYISMRRSFFSSVLVYHKANCGYRSHIINDIIDEVIIYPSNWYVKTMWKAPSHKPVESIGVNYDLYIDALHFHTEVISSLSFESTTRQTCGYRLYIRWQNWWSHYFPV